MALVKSSTNWTVRSERQLRNSFKFVLCTEDTGYRAYPPIGVEEKNCLMLSKPSDDVKSGLYNICEVKFSVKQILRIYLFRFVCTCKKLEVFLGPEKEYMATVHGFIPEGEECEVRSGAVSLPFFHFDVEIDRYGVKDITLRFFIKTENLFIGDIILFMYKDELIDIEEPRFDMRNIQHMVENCKVSASAPKKDTYKTFLEAFSLNQKRVGERMGNVNTKTNPSANCPTLDENTLIKHIDRKLEEMETKIFVRINQMEERCDAKLEAIKNLLEKGLK